MLRESVKVAQASDLDASWCRLPLEAFQRSKASSSEQSDISVLLQDLSLKLTNPVSSNVEAFGLGGEKD